MLWVSDLLILAAGRGAAVLVEQPSVQPPSAAPGSSSGQPGGASAALVPAAAAPLRMTWGPVRGAAAGSGLVPLPPRVRTHFLTQQRTVHGAAKTKFACSGPCWAISRDAACTAIDRATYGGLCSCERVPAHLQLWQHMQLWQHAALAAAASAPNGLTGLCLTCRVTCAAGYKLVTEECVSPLTCVHIGGEELSMDGHRSMAPPAFAVHGAIKQEDPAASNNNEANFFSDGRAGSPKGPAHA